MIEPFTSSSIDRIYARILSLLQKDGRISNFKLAEEVHLFLSAVLEREGVQRVEGLFWAMRLSLIRSS